MVSISNISSNYLASVSDRLEEINNQLKDLPKVLDLQTLEKLQDGEYDITLEEYTDMNSYRTTMTAFYGSSSANKFNSALGGFLGYNNKQVNAKEFIQELQDRGVSSESALKIYSALKSYSTLNSLFGKQNSFVSAKI